MSHNASLVISFYFISLPLRDDLGENFPFPFYTAGSKEVFKKEL